MAQGLVSGGPVIIQSTLCGPITETPNDGSAVLTVTAPDVGYVSFRYVPVP